MALPAIGFLRVPEPKSSKYRMHIDVRVVGKPPWDRDVRERLVSATAWRPRRRRRDRGARGVLRGEHIGHVVLLDPGGNEFCVA